MGEFTLLFPSLSAELIANIYEGVCYIMQLKNHTVHHKMEDRY